MKTKTASDPAKIDPAKILEGLRKIAAAEYDTHGANAVKLQAEAREAWNKPNPPWGPKHEIVIGAYYWQRTGAWMKRVVDIDGSDIYWADEIGNGRCKRSVFMRSITGPV
jgi:hypothetical protein